MIRSTDGSAARGEQVLEVVDHADGERPQAVESFHREALEFRARLECSIRYVEPLLPGARPPFAVSFASRRL